MQLNFRILEATICTLRFAFMVRSILHSSFTDKESFAEIYNLVIKRTENDTWYLCIFYFKLYKIYCFRNTFILYNIYFLDYIVGKKKRKKKRKIIFENQFKKLNWKVEKYSHKKLLKIYVHIFWLVIKLLSNKMNIVLVMMNTLDVKKYKKLKS